MKVYLLQEGDGSDGDETQVIGVYLLREVAQAAAEAGERADFERWSQPGLGEPLIPDAAMTAIIAMMERPNPLYDHLYPPPTEPRVEPEGLSPWERHVWISEMGGDDWGRWQVSEWEVQ